MKIMLFVQGYKRR